MLPKEMSYWSKALRLFDGGDLQQFVFLVSFVLLFILFCLD